MLVGEVWVCGGQSNMEWTLRSSRDADLELTGADHGQIRYLRVPKIASPTPEDDFPRKDEGAWRQCVRGQVQDCTAVGYYFAVRLSRNLRVPVGLIDISWGGTLAQHWSSAESLRAIPEMESDIAAFEKRRRAWTDGGGQAGADERYQQALADWEQAQAAAATAGESKPRKPGKGAFEDPAKQRQPAGMHNGMLLPIAPATIRGALFYQGENNSFGTAWKPFHRTFPSVIADWRGAFGDPELPMGLIQIAGWSTRRSMTYDMNHHTNIVREIQFTTWRSTPNTGLIVTYDTNSNGNIHPGHKRPVGERSARWALAEVYGAPNASNAQPLEWRGPIYESTQVTGAKLVVSFEAGTCRGLRLDRDEANGIYVAGADQVFQHASARVLKGDKLEVWCDEVPEPVSVRYGWSNLPSGNLLNGRELPAYPFRSDRWPLTPHQSEGSYLIDGARAADSK
ncbi:MAG: sialate O-acetylesterase [Planctomycetota bacterium]